MTNIYECLYRCWRRKRQPTPVFLPGESCEQRSLVGCHLWGHTESDITEATQHACMHWRRQWQPTPVFLPAESQGWGSLVGCCLGDHKESDTTEVAQQQQQQGMFYLILQVLVCQNYFFLHLKALSNFPCDFSLTHWLFKIVFLTKIQNNTRNKE